MPATAPALPDMSGVTGGFPHGLSAIPPDGAGWSITVNPGDDLQAKLQQGVNTGGSGTIYLGLGTWGTPGNNGYVLPARPDDGTWITIRPIPSLETQIAPAGTRIDPTLHAAFMPKLSVPAYGTGGLGALNAFDDTHGWRIIGLDIFIGATYPDNELYHLVGLGMGFAAFDTHASSPTDGSRYILERCYLHCGSARPNFNRWIVGVKIGGYDVRVRDCYITEVSHASADTQAIGVTDSQGLHWFENNYLAATGENIMYGGGGTTGDTLSGPNPYGDRYLPKDITVVRNTFEKLPRWNPNAAAWGGTWDGQFRSAIKGAFELKNAKRVLLEGNTIRNVFFYASAGPYVAVALDAFSQPIRINGVDRPSGYTEAGQILTTQARVEDVTIRYNSFDLVSGVVQLWPGNRPVRRVHIHDNVALRVRHDIAWMASDPNDVFARGAGNYLWAVAMTLTGGPDNLLDACEDISIEHNTCLPCTRGAFGILGSYAYAPKYNRLTVRNNIIGYGFGGVYPGDGSDLHGGDAAANWGPFYDANCPGRDFQRNFLVSAETTSAFVPGGGSGLARQTAENVTSRYDAARWIAADAAGAHPHGIDLATGQLDPTSPFKAGGTYEATDRAARVGAGLSGDLGVDFFALAAAQAGTTTIISVLPRVASGRAAVAVF